MQMEQVELRKKWKAEGDKWPDIVSKMQTRIGLNTGTATVGNMGALDRFNYTMMGDMVNLAARSESGAKAYGAYIMITEDTKRAAEKQGSGIAYRYLDKIVVKLENLIEVAIIGADNNCDFTSGCLSGVLEGLLQQPYSVVEEMVGEETRLFKFNKK